MKICGTFLSLFIVSIAHSQGTTSYASIDAYAQQVDASSPAELAQKLIAPYTIDREKARAIFSWIAQHITYGSGSNNHGNKSKTATADASLIMDTSTVLTPVNQLAAEVVLKKRTAICYGYSRLFKYLCDCAGIPCEIVNGYARGDFNKIERNFRTNHSWNSVWLDSAWHLVDVTWASGYFTYLSNEFIKHFDDQYFLTSPEQFALDHFPDDLRWSLLQQPPTIGEFQFSPYKGRCFTKYGIVSYWPVNGVIHALVGDTIRLEINRAVDPDRKIAGGSIEDTVGFENFPRLIYCKPLPLTGNPGIVHYSYIVPSADAQWLHLVYNDDVILRYKLEVSSQKEN